MLAGEGPSTLHVYNALAGRFGSVAVILEEPVPRSLLLRRRAKKLGWATVLGQLLFIAGVLPALRRRGARRVDEIKRVFGLSEAEIRGDVVRVPSVNSPAAREALRALSPDVVVVNGTRILDRETLGCVEVPMVNLHAGITPAYRGVHGGYWALREGHAGLAGSTVHLVDAGIDTGAVIGQATFTPGPRDSFATYPYLHTAAGLPLLLSAVERALSGTLAAHPPRAELPSKLRSHPTAWQYLYGRVRRGVR